jgi:hypothetical protein
MAQLFGFLLYLSMLIACFAYGGFWVGLGFLVISAFLVPQLNK